MTLEWYEVDFDMKYSHGIRVQAKNKVDAKKKAFKKFNSIRNRRSQYNVWAEKL